MKSNNQAFNLISKNYLSSERIKLKKDILKNLNSKSIIKIDALKLVLYSNKRIYELFFNNGYFFIKALNKSKSKEENKLKKSEFILKIDSDFSNGSGVVLLNKEPIYCTIETFYKSYNAKLYFRDNFYIKIED